ncbi:unnamed protein product [Parascedosporium putredinis]|uniref:Uncharacterized protein n=1 Tax=Parascedosporium putredinis TaxID=1442378 RepID=A0A9P1HB52_9PEZI|nr:unnamed protein product [Parascedosporium putredinis]CAI8005158.1 unnamed protein product [Parascedosporium putredinis]
MALPGIASSSAAAPLTRDEERAIALIQIVALLKVLHQQPLDSTRHEDDLEIVNKEGYELTFQREQELTGLLAFLSNTKYDNQRIPAIAVQESRAPYELQILMAVNGGKPGDDNGTIQKVLDGFERVFQPLSGIRDGPERDIENEDKIRSNVYDAILNMCNTRIIERLDPGKMNQKTTVEKKEPMKERLEAAIDLLKEDNPRDENLRDAAEDFKARARLAIRGIAAWEKHQVMADMRALVDRFYELNEMPKFVDIVSHIEKRSKQAGRGAASLSRALPKLRGIRMQPNF